MYSGTKKFVSIFIIKNVIKWLNNKFKVIKVCEILFFLYAKAYN